MSQRLFERIGLKKLNVEVTLKWNVLWEDLATFCEVGKNRFYSFGLTSHQNLVKHIFGYYTNPVSELLQSQLFSTRRGSFFKKKNIKY